MLNSLPNMKTWIKSTLTSKLEIAHIKVDDYTGGDDHFQMLVVSPQFEGKTTVARHRIVYEALGDAMRQRIHALTMTTLTPAEWEVAGKQ